MDGVIEVCLDLEDKTLWPWPRSKTTVLGFGLDTLAFVTCNECALRNETETVGYCLCLRAVALWKGWGQLHPSRKIGTFWPPFFQPTMPLFACFDCCN